MILDTNFKKEFMEVRKNNQLTTKHICDIFKISKTTYFKYKKLLEAEDRKSGIKKHEHKKHIVKETYDRFVEKKIPFTTKDISKECGVTWGLVKEIIKSSGLTPTHILRKKWAIERCYDVYKDLEKTKTRITFAEIRTKAKATISEVKAFLREYDLEYIIPRGIEWR